MEIKLFTIPNLFTCGNLLCGCVGIVAVFHSDLLLASIMIGLAGVFDFLDGFLARFLKSSSAIGKELDSLADVVTFGVLPSCIVYSLIQEAVPDIYSLWKAYLAFIIAVFSALRLAKFNIDTRQAESFIGVPTPANAFLIGSIPLILYQYPETKTWIVDANYLIIFSLVCSFLLVAEIPLFALKFKSFGWKGNEIKFIFLILSAILLVLLKFAAVPIIIFLYIGLSVVQNLLKKSA
ncbi:MAG: CDP-diacylglycerol--serine O-phosphatidyltransferase [Spirosomataceae bacterium]